MILILNPVNLLKLRAKIHPNRIAIEDAHGSMTYIQFFIFVKKIAKKLVDIGIKQGDTVVTCLPNNVDWIFTNALFHLSAITCSSKNFISLDKKIKIDWVLSNKIISNFKNENIILINNDWINDAHKRKPDNAIVLYKSNESICRLILTSGTTGNEKIVPLSINTMNKRLYSIPSYWKSRGSEINMMDISTVGGFFSAINSVQTGGIFYRANAAEETVLLANKKQITGIIGSPNQLSSLVNEVEFDSTNLESLKEIKSAGGPLPKRLASTLHDKFNVDIYNVYGSTEVGGICLSMIECQDYNPMNAGYPLPSSEVEIVNNAHEPLPYNEEGMVRVKTIGMVSGYYLEPEATSESFRDGWFYPGDRGRLTKDGLLVLAGRESELINSGGVKISPFLIEQILLESNYITDAAAFSVINKYGIEVVVAIVVCSDNLEINNLNKELKLKFTSSNKPSYLFKVDKIPRNKMGKTMIFKLKNKFTEIISKIENDNSIKINDFS